MRIAIAIMLTSSVNSVVGNDSAAGVWITGDEDGLIELRQVDDKLEGIIVGSLSDPDGTQPERLDKLNPDPALRERPLMNLNIFTDLRASGDNQWKGQVYDPNSGKTYKCTLTMVDVNTLKLRGYVGISLLGRTEYWQRLRD